MKRKNQLMLSIILGITVSAGAQSTNLERLLDTAMDNYPAIKSARLRTLAAEQDVKSAQLELIPRLSASYQVNYATYNNITGMLFPGNIPPISGPPSDGNISQMATGSAAGLLMTWSPFTFGKRSANLNHAKSGAEAQKIQEDLIQLEYQVRFIETYLNFHSLISLEASQAAELERQEYNLSLSRQLVKNGLRPGVDTSQIKAEYTRTFIELLTIQREKEQYKELLLEYLGGAESFLSDEDWLINHSNNVRLPGVTSPDHPQLALASQKVRSLEWELAGIRRSLYPDLILWGTGFARGSAVGVSGFEGNNEGFRLTHQNAGIGFQLNLPILDIPSTSSKLKKQNLLISAFNEEEKMLKLSLQREKNIAILSLQNALKTAQYAETLTEFSEYSFQAVQARYAAGLVNLTELLNSQAQLKKAESETVIIRTELWKSLLYLAAVEGNIEIFLEQIR